MIDFEQARINMIDGQIHPSGVVSSQILESFANCPRELFVPEKLRSISYNDKSIDIGQGRFLLSPTTHSKMLQVAEVNKSDLVLDIGSGTGYSSAILSPIVTTVIALENNKRQIDRATKLWVQLGACNIALIEGKLEKGASSQAPYSLIIINGMVDSVPQNILDQMDINGRLVTIIKNTDDPIGYVTLFVKSSSGDITSKKVFDANAPFLKEFKPKPKFEF